MLDLLEASCRLALAGALQVHLTPGLDRLLFVAIFLDVPAAAKGTFLLQR